MWKYSALLLLAMGVAILNYNSHQKNIHRFDMNDDLLTINDQAFHPPNRVPLYYYLYWDPEKDGNISKLESMIESFKQLKITDLVLGPLNRQLLSDEKSLNTSSGKYTDSLEKFDPRFLEMSRLTGFLYRANLKSIRSHICINLNSVNKISSAANNKERTYLFRPSDNECTDKTEDLATCTKKNTKDFMDEKPEVARYLHQVLNSIWVSKGFSGAFLYEGEYYHEKTLRFFTEEFSKLRGEQFELNVFFEESNSSDLIRLMENNILKKVFLYDYPFVLKNVLEGNISVNFFQTYLENIFNRHHNKIIVPLTTLDKGIGQILNNKKAFINKSWLFTIGLGGQLFLSNYNDIESNFKFIELYKKYYEKLGGRLKVVGTNNPNIFCISKNKLKNKEFTLNSISCMNLSNSSQELEIKNLDKIWNNGTLEIVTNKIQSASEKLGILLPHETKIFIAN